MKQARAKEEIEKKEADRLLYKEQFAHHGRKGVLESGFGNDVLYLQIMLELLR